MPLVDLAALDPGGPQPPGSVALVGGGPGSPGLITLRGLRLLHEADVVVADRLGPRDLLASLDPSVEVVDVGKTPFCDGITQREIEVLMLARAAAGRRVVRLKGGDPFVFGRGGEEAIACAAAGVPCEVVPGVSSAVAAAASVGVPVTHRAEALSVTIVSAHARPGAAGPDWPAIARVGGTLVVLMGVSRLGAVTGSLVAAGLPASTPVVLVERATLPDSRHVDGTLGDINERAVAAAIEAPAVLVVGSVVAVGRRIGALAAEVLA